MINTCSFVGRITKDLQLKHTPAGKPVLSYQIAVQRAYKGQDGQKPTDFISCVTWEKDGEFLAKNGKKGAMVAVKGRMETRSYDHAQYPIKVNVTELKTEEVQLLDWNDDGPQQNNPSGGYGSQGAGNRQNQDYGNPYNDNRYQGNNGGYNQGGYNQGNQSSGGYGNYQGAAAPPQQNRNQGSGNPGPGYNGGGQGSGYGEPIDINDEDLPF
jgi:single-strand DNA-binding protein